MTKVSRILCKPGQSYSEEIQNMGSISSGVGAGWKADIYTTF